MLDPLNVKYFRFAVGSDIGKESENDIASKCIICGDSDTKDKVKRLHLYRKKGYDNDIVHCFNCDWKGNMYSFLKEMNTNLYEQYLKENRESSFNEMKERHQNNEKVEASIQIGAKKEFGKTRLNKPTVEESEETETVVETYRNYPSKLYDLPKEFIPAEKSFKAKEYLKGRRINPEGLYFSKDWLNFNGKNMPLKNSIIIPLWANEKEKIIYGFQARSTETKFFYTFIPEENTGYKVWNWFNIDTEKRIFVFESVFDALSSGLPKDQIVGALGADLNDVRISEVQEAIFCLDNQFQDLTSKKKSIELLKDGYRVFIWDKNTPEKDANKWLTNHSNKSVKDFAKIILSNIYEGTKGILKIKLKR